MTTPSSHCPRLRYAVLGDIHSNLEALTAVVKDAQDQQCTHYACVGDIVGYNANPIECLRIIRDLGMRCVKGNHDEYCSADQTPQNFSPRAAAAVLWTQQRLADADKDWLRNLKYTRLVGSFTIVHATLDTPERWGYVLDRLAAAASFSYQNTAVCFFGHTHLPRVFVRDSAVREGAYSKLKIEPGRKYFVNAGSVGEPRDGNPHAAYAIYDASEGSIELRRVPYDVEAVEGKVRMAGLMERKRRNF